MKKQEEKKKKRNRETTLTQHSCNNKTRSMCCVSSYLCRVGCRNPDTKYLELRTRTLCENIVSKHPLSVGCLSPGLHRNSKWQTNATTKNMWFVRFLEKTTQQRPTAERWGERTCTPPSEFQLCSEGSGLTRTCRAGSGSGQVLSNMSLWSFKEQKRHKKLRLTDANLYDEEQRESWCHHHDVILT